MPKMVFPSALHTIRGCNPAKIGIARLCKVWVQQDTLGNSTLTPCQRQPQNVP